MWFIEFNIVFAAVVLLFNPLLYKKGSIHWNRWLLLSLPFLFFGISYFKTKISSLEGLATIQYPTIDLNFDQISLTESIDWLSIVYVTGVICTLLFFLYSLFALVSGFRKQELVEKTNKYVVYQGNLNTSFFNHVVIDKNLSEENKHIVFLHEKAHADQLHSIDRLILALIQCFMWFNPAVYLWGKMIINNHEFLADEEVTHKETNEKYTLFLLNQKLNVNNFNPYSLTSNMSNLKSRIMKMNEKKRVIKYLYLILPIVAIATLSFTFNGKEGTVNTSIISSNITDPVEDPDVFPEFNGGNEAMMSFLQSEIKYPKKAKKDKTEGKVFVSMIINKDGAVTQVESLRGPTKELKQEAERVVKKMPNWSPGEKDGKTVAVKVVLPINFKL